MGSSNSIEKPPLELRVLPTLASRRQVARSADKYSKARWNCSARAGQLAPQGINQVSHPPRLGKRLFLVRGALPFERAGTIQRRMLGESEESISDEAGLVQLLGEMRPELSRFMLVRQCDPAEVDDLLQDLFVKLSSLRAGPVSNPRAYLYQMANNLLHDHRRGRRRQQARDDHWVRSQVGPDLEKDASPSPEDTAISRNELARVNETLALMPERTAQILRMYRLDGISQKEIANSLGLSLSAVEKHLQRAYRKLMLLREELDRNPKPSSKEADDVSVS